MPRLTEEQRQATDARVDVHRRIEGLYANRQFIAVHCLLCNWACNGRTLDEALLVKQGHEGKHPEKAEWDANSLTAREALDALHDHDCVPGPCLCICGCQVALGCTELLGPLCSTCTVQASRGNPAHGAKEEGDAPFHGRADAAATQWSPMMEKLRKAEDTLKEIQNWLLLALITLDDPADRLYHAADRTWWKREGTHLVTAGPPLPVEGQEEADEW